MQDLTKPDELIAWLEEQPREVAVTIAARAALRALPALVAAFTRNRDAPNLRAALVLPTFRVVAVPWVAATYPTNGTNLAVAADASYTAANAAVRFASDVRAAATDVHAAAAAATTVYAAAYAATRVAATTVYVYAAAARIGFKAATAGTAAHAAAAARDAAEIDRGVKCSDVAGDPLWRDGIPDQTQSRWLSLKKRLLNADEDWEVWTDWYDARLNGRSTHPNLSPAANEEIEIARALIAEEIWEQGPAVVNAHIKELIGQLEPDQSPELKQDPLGAQITTRGDRLGFVPFPVEDEANDPVTRQLHDQIRQKARSLAEAAPRITNENPALAAAAALYFKVVDRDIKDVAAEIGTVWSLSASLGSFRDQDQGAQTAPDGFVEPLATDIRRLLDDLVLVCGPFVRRFAVARELDDELARFEDRREQRVTAGVVFDLVVRHQVLEDDAASTLTVSRKAGEGEGPHATKARGWFGKTTRNVAIAVVVGLPLYLAKPSADKIGGRLAETKLVEKLGDWAVEGSDSVLELFEGAPPDQRGAIEEGLKRLREMRQDPAIDI